MKNTRRTKITAETYELTVIRVKKNQTAADSYCAVCRKRAEHLTVAQTVTVLALSEREIYCLAANGRIHSRVNSAGTLLLCGHSLAALAKD